jgi:hypothetical protein
MKKLDEIIEDIKRGKTEREMSIPEIPYCKHCNGYGNECTCLKKEDYE